MPDLSADAVAPLFRVLSHYLGADPTCCYCFPLTAKGLCACGVCKRGKTKHPRPDLPLKEPPQNHSDLAPEVAIQMQDGRFGVLAGPSGLVIIDVDCKKGKKGFATLAAAAKILGELPHTLVQTTPSGGKHYFFRVPEVRRGVAKSKGSNVYNAAAGLAPGSDGGIDVLVGMNDLALAGAGYTLESLPRALPELPLAWFDIIPNRGGETTGESMGAYCGPAWETHDAESLAWARKEYRAECIKTPAGGKGDRNPGLVNLAILARVYGLPPEESIPIAWDAWNSRCTPPLTDPQDPDFSKTFFWQWSQGFADIGGRMLFELDTWTRGLAGDAAHDEPRAQMTAEQIEAIQADLNAGAVQASRAPKRRARMLPNPSHEYTFRRTKDLLGKQEAITGYDLQTQMEMSEVWQGVFQWDEFADRPVAVNPPFPLALERGERDKNDLTLISRWINCVLGRHAQDDVIEKTIVALAKACTYHPLQEYLDDLDDPTLRPETAERWLVLWAKQRLRIEAAEERAVIIRQLVASVARAYEPGCEVHTCVLLCGAEGSGKTSLLKALFGEYYVAMAGSLEDKDAKLGMIGKWCIELGERASVKKTERGALLTFMTSNVDYIRRPYESAHKEYPRTSTLWASDNNLEVLEETNKGMRRFEPVTMTHAIDHAAVARERDEVWQMARKLYLSGFRYWLDQEGHKLAAERKKAYLNEDVKGDMCVSFAERIHDQGQTVTTSAILMMLYGGDMAGFARASKGDQMMVGRALLARDWTKHRNTANGWYYDPPYREPESEPEEPPNALEAPDLARFFADWPTPYRK